jgi:hemolysin activation/secretion protein
MFSVVRLVAIAVCFAGASLALAVDVPDAVRAGAIRPDERRAAAPPPPQAPVFEVPAVPARALDIDAGERVVVSAFTLEGALPRPEFDIDPAEIEALLEAAVTERPEGFTVGRLQEVADRVTRYYRARGLILAQAYVPEQTVTGGKVAIHILEGRLDRVTTEGNDLFAGRLLSRPFDDLLGRPVSSRIVESRLLSISDYPGVSLFGVFQPGERVGTTDLVINVQRERRFSWLGRVDNHGLRETGRRRYRMEGQVNNLTGAGDWLNATVQATGQPSNSLFWAALYERPLWGDVWASLSASRNEFDVGGEFRAQGIESETWNLRAALTLDVIRSRQRNLAMTMALDRKHAQTDVLADPQTREELAVVSLSAAYDAVDVRGSGLNAALVEFSHGFNDLLGSMDDTLAIVPPSRVDADGVFAQGEFNKVLIAFSRLQSLSVLHRALRQHSVLLRTELQYSDNLLVPLEQYAIGGPANVRAYQPTEALYDKALFASVEWIVNAPFIADQPAFGNRTWGEVLQISAFYDWAIGRLNKPFIPSERTQNYGGAGLSLTITNPGLFAVHLIAAKRTTDPAPENGRELQYWLDFSLSY